MQILKSVQKAAVHIALGVASILLVVMLLCLFFQVIFRYVLARPLSWSEEVARFSFVWVSILGAAATITGSIAQGVDLFSRKLPLKWQAGINVLVHVLIFVFCALLTVKGFELTTIVHRQTSPALGLRMSFVYGAIPIGSLLMILILGIEVIMKLYGFYSKSRVVQGVQA